MWTFVIALICTIRPARATLQKATAKRFARTDLNIAGKTVEEESNSNRHEVEAFDQILRFVAGQHAVFGTDNCIVPLLPTGAPCPSRFRQTMVQSFSAGIFQMEGQSFASAFFF